MSLSDKRLAELSQGAHALGSPVALELLEEVERLRAEPLRHAERDREVAARAWDEGRIAQLVDVLLPGEPTPNPYRAGGE